jgi:signal transduction histidine kinase
MRGRAWRPARRAASASQRAVVKHPDGRGSVGPAKLLGRLGRETGFALLALSVLVIAVLVSALMLARHDHSLLLEQFAMRRLQQAERAARLIADELTVIAHTVRFAAQLVEASESDVDRNRALSGLLAASGPDLAFVRYDATGKQRERVEDPVDRRRLTWTALDTDLARLAQRVLRTPPGTLLVSSSLGLAPGERVRAVATRIANGSRSGALVLVIDDTQLLDDLGLIGLRKDTQLLVVGPDGQPLPVSSPTLRAETRSSGPLPSALRELLRRMQAPTSGVVWLDRDDASALGLPPLRAVAAHVTVPTRGTGTWAVATISSTAVVRSYERTTRLRFGAAAGSIALALLGFGAHIVRVSRRAAAAEERMRAAEELAQLESQLVRAEKLSTVGVLAAGIAHEVGTPLGVVRGRAEYLLDRLGDDERSRRSLEVIVDQSDLVSRIISQLLNFSALKEPDARPVAVAGALIAVTDLLRFEAQRRNLSLHAEPPASDLVVAADPDQLQQVLVNLVMNACDASPANSVVTLRALEGPPSAGEPCVRFEIVDHGQGIAQENRHRIFDPFFTTKKRGQGTGLGLSVVARIVENHRARLEVESRLGQGTRVMLDWPQPRSGQGGSGVC